MANIVKIKVIDENGQKLNNLSVGDKIKANINNNYYTFNPTDSTITLKNDIVNNNLFIKEVGFDSEYVKYWCSYIYRPDMCSYSINNINGGNVPYQENTDIIIQFLPKDWKSCVSVTLKPSLTIPDNYIIGTPVPDDAQKIKITYIEYDNDIPISSRGLQNCILDDNGTKTIDLGPNFWTGFQGLTNIDDIPMLEANITYFKPFRITKDVLGNDKITETIKNTDLTYTANLQFEVKDPTVAYYTKESQIQRYFITEPYRYRINILFPDNPFVIIPKNTNFTIKYIDSDHPDSTNPQSIKFPYDGNAKGIVPTSILTSYIKFKIIDIYAIGSNNEPYFCAYLNHINETHRHFWYDNEGIFDTTLNDAKTTVTQNTTTNVFLIMCPKNNDCTQISPHISTPVEPSNVSVKYLYIFDSLTKNTDYQYSTTKPESFIKVGSSNTQMGSWARYGFNVHNEDYTLELQSPKTTDLTQDYDLYLNNSLIKPTSEENNIRKYTFKSLEKNNYEYFTGSPKFEVLPKTHIKYVIDKSVTDNKCGISISLSDGTNTKNYSINESKTEIVTDISGNEKSNIKQTLQLTGSTLKPLNPKGSIQIEYNGITESVDNGTIDFPFISKSAISMPNTWNNVGITYTISLQTTQPSDTPLEQQAQFGLQINTSGVKNDLKYTLNINDSNLKFVGVGMKDEDTNKHSKFYHSTVGQNTSGSILLIDGNQTLENTLNFNLYLSDTSYCVTNKNIEIPFRGVSNNIYGKGATLFLNDYIEENEFYRGKNQIKLSKIDVPYKISMSIMDTTNNTILESIDKNVNGTDSTFDIADKYSDDKKYSLTVKEIKATIGGKEVGLPRYNFNLVEGGQKVSYIKNPPIAFSNETNNDVTMDNIITIDGVQIGDTIKLPALGTIEPQNIYFTSYIKEVRLTSTEGIKINANFNSGNSTPVSTDSPLTITAPGDGNFIKQITISKPVV